MIFLRGTDGSENGSRRIFDHGGCGERPILQELVFDTRNLCGRTDTYATSANEFLTCDE